MDVRKIDVNMAEATSSKQQKIEWINLQRLELRGMAFFEVGKKDFDRLKQGVSVSQGVDQLKKCPSGINITFKTDSPFIKIKAKLRSGAYMSHMTAVGTIGFDLYYHDVDGWVFIYTTKINAASYELDLLKDVSREEREYRIYFPLYAGLDEAILGIEEGSKIEFLKEKQEKIVVYGTSISQGGCATRPGMAYSTIMDRHLPYEVINLGFSGSCKLEESIADMIQEIHPKYLVLEVEANSPSPEVLAEKLPKFIDIIPQDVRIILMSHFPEGMSRLKPEIKETFKRFYDIEKNQKRVLFIDGEELLKEYGFEETVDGVHLTDLGFYAVAKKLIRVIEGWDQL